MKTDASPRMNMTPFVFNDAMVRGCLDDRGEPWFVARDVCQVLDIANSRDAVAGLDDDEKITVANPDGNPRAGIPHEMTIISESGLYALVFRSRKPEARRFRKWVTAEVLPALRRQGWYGRPGNAADGAASLPDVAAGLRPRMRKEVMALAVRMAALDDGGSEEALRWFGELARIMSDDAPPAQTTEDGGNADRPAAAQQAAAFAEHCLRLAPGRKESGATLYRAYLKWWNPDQGSRLTLSAFGSALSHIYPKTRSGSVWYLDVRLKRGWR